MKTFIFEGVATSGKSMLISKLIANLPASKRVEVVPETETLMIIEDNTVSDVSIKYLSRLIDETYRQSSDIVIFDRLYLTHIIRTNSSVSEFGEIQQMLLPFSPTIIFLEVNESAIADRIQKAWGHRDPEWERYVRTKGNDINEISEYYIQQQRKQQQLLSEIALPYRKYDTTLHQYDFILEDLLTLI